MQKIFTLLLCLLSGTGVWSQTRYYVKPAGSDANTGLSWEQAFKTMQAALQAVNSNSEIWTAAGTYYPDEGGGKTDNDRAATFVMKNNLAIYGGFAGTETELSQRNWRTNITTLSGDLTNNDFVSGTGNALSISNNGENSYHVIANNNTGLNSTAVLDGFTVKGGNASGSGVNAVGAGMYNLNASPTIKHCTFYANVATEAAGAVYNNASPGKLTNCVFEKNVSVYGGAIYNFGTASGNITNSVFVGNRASAAGAAILNYNSSLSITNCTFSQNAGRTLANYASSSLTLTNSILWANVGDAIYNENANSSTTANYSDITGGYEGTGNINQDPLFVDPANGNLRLQPCSPVIDAGDNTANTSATDWYGNPRKVRAIDMGAFEFQGELPASSRTLYVNAAAAPGGDGKSWASAFKYLQDALANTCGSVTPIWVAKGTYYPDEGGNNLDNDRAATFVMKQDIAIYGGFSGNETELSQRDWRNNKTILSGDYNNDDVVTGSGSTLTISGNDENCFSVIVNYQNSLTQTSILDGFTITGGNANSFIPHDLGGGMYTYELSPTVANCTFIGNSGSFGGGLDADFSSPTLANCFFIKNYGVYGGGAFFYGSSPNLSDCIFEGNRAERGGAFFNNASSPTIRNSTLTGNAANEGGGFFDYHSSSTLKNCIIWENTGGSIFTSSSIPTITYSNIEGGYEGAGNLNQDPLFVDPANGNLRLQPCSPSIDAGDYTEASLGTDLDGNPRQVRTIDMGAYEFQDVPPPTQNWYQDNDGDGFGNPAVMLAQCLQPSGYVINNTDCNDTNADVWQTGNFYTDKDHDGYTSAATMEVCYGADIPAGYTTSKSDVADCNDDDPAVWRSTMVYRDQDRDGYTAGDAVPLCFGTKVPAGYRTERSAIEDCNDNSRAQWQSAILFRDKDRDGYTTGAGELICYGSAIPVGYRAAPSATEDCNDRDADRWRSEILYVDKDGDGYTIGEGRMVCYGASAPVGYRSVRSAMEDCNDNDPAVWQEQVYYRDSDGDGYGDAKIRALICSSTPPAGYVANSTDCNDADAGVWQAAVLYADNDADGYTNRKGVLTCYGSTLPAGYSMFRTTPADCDDADPNGQRKKTYYADNDGDGFGNPAAPIRLCSMNPPAGYVKNNADCNDNQVMYRDADGDGYGSTTKVACNGVSNYMDCNDKDPHINCIRQKQVQTSAAPDTIALQAAPNPFGSSTTIRYSLPENAQVDIRLYDGVGRLVATIFSGQQLMGKQQHTFNAKRLIKGTYYCRLTASMASGKKYSIAAKLIKGE